VGTQLGNGAMQSGKWNNQGCLESVILPYTVDSTRECLTVSSVKQEPEAQFCLAKVSGHLSMGPKCPVDTTFCQSVQDPGTKRAGTSGSRFLRLQSWSRPKGMTVIGNINGGGTSRLSWKRHPLHYTAEKNNDIVKFAGKWMELENVILSELYFYSCYVCVVYQKSMQSCLRDLGFEDQEERSRKNGAGRTEQTTS
ncbi:hypothetical protein STEG23_037226, partial [Scotinomys teguina]